MARVSTAAKNAALAGLGALFNGGTVRLYAAPLPASLGGSGGGLQLAQCTLSSPAFGSPSGGTITATSIADGEADLTGEAAWFACYSSAGAALMDGEVGAELTMAETNLTAGGTVSIDSLSITLP